MAVVVALCVYLLTYLLCIDSIPSSLHCQSRCRLTPYSTSLLFPCNSHIVRFVPPGFCVVRRHTNGGDGRKNAGRNSPPRSKKRGGGASSSSSKGASVASSAGSGGGTIPANLNFGTAGERVYLCYRRSREGNPLTAILPLVPSAQESVPEGYTVLERTPRNYVADINHGAGPALFLAFRQRLANLEPLRPLPLVLAVYYSNLQLDSKAGDAAAAAGIAAACGLASAPDRTRGKLNDGVVVWERRLRAYYCTGGTVVPSEVGKFHVMDRSTHPLLSPSSVTNRLSLIEASRRQKAAEKVGPGQKNQNALPSPKSDGSVYSSPFKSKGDRPRDNSAHSTPSPSLDCGVSLLNSRHSSNDINGSICTDEASVVSNSSASIHSVSRAKGLSWNASSVDTRAESLSLHGISGHGQPDAIRSSPMPSPYATKKSMFREGDDDYENDDEDIAADLFGKKEVDDARAKARTIFTHPDADADR